jgi:hypothetical protein
MFSVTHLLTEEVKEKEEVIRLIRTQLNNTSLSISSFSFRFGMFVVRC